MEIILSIIMGISLSAASGFRVFVPFLILSGSSLLGWVDLGSNASWMATYPAFITFAIATIFEIIGYYSPWVDNMLDLIATPLAIVAGVVLTSSMIVDINPLLKWALAIVCGGGAAINVQLLTVKVRALSSFFTTGVGNPVVSTIENISSIFISILAIVVPIISFIIVIIIVYLIYKKVVKEKQRQGMTNYS